MKGSVNSIETFGLVDGPGIRTVVFLNGCKLRCKYCHNPEMWTIGDKNMKVSEVVDLIIKNKPYFKKGGGVTFSGGEPLLQCEFLTEICKILKKENIHIAIDTAGVTNGNYLEILYYTDLVILDIKHFTKEGYYQITGQNIEPSLNFIDDVVRLKKEVWIRQVIIPGVNDNYNYVKNLKKFILKIPNVTKIEFLPFHRLGKEKYEKLNILYPYEDMLDMSKKKTNELHEYMMTEDEQ